LTSTAAWLLTSANPGTAANLGCRNADDLALVDRITENILDVQSIDRSSECCAMSGASIHALGLSGSMNDMSMLYTCKARESGIRGRARAIEEKCDLLWVWVQL
jgi:hypothetical protein